MTEFDKIYKSLQRAETEGYYKVFKAEATRHVAPVGTVHSHSDGYKYQKQNDGSWTKLEEKHTDKPPIDIKQHGSYWNGKIYGNEKYGHTLYVDNKKIDITPEQKKHLDNEQDINNKKNSLKEFIIGQNLKDIEENKNLKRNELIELGKQIKLREEKEKEEKRKKQEEEFEKLLESARRATELRNR